jgi:transglutaminase-like putative cysteine protease
MDDWLIAQLRRVRPAVGWPLFAMALAAALCPGMAAAGSDLALPAGLFAWAGTLGLLLGMGAGRGGPRRGWRRAAHGLLWGLLALGGGGLLLGAVGRALPPVGLLWQDAAACAAWLPQVLHRGEPAPPPPLLRTWLFLGESLPRFAGTLAAAPNAGERGARLLAAAGGVLSTWIGGIALGWGLARRRPLLGWGLPLLVALGVAVIPGAGAGAPLVIGMALLLVLAAVTGFGLRARTWDQASVDYSDELGRDVSIWSTAGILALLLLAALIPTSLRNPLTEWLWRDVELPSGIAALERSGPRATTANPAQVGLSTLPAVPLGVSLEGTPPDKIVLRVRVNAPLPPGPAPRYWRARVLNLYDGRAWTTNARVGPYAGLPPSQAPDGLIVQDIEDLRDDPQVLIGVPDILGTNVSAQAERLPDGSIAALTASLPSEYRVVSRPQELAPVPPPNVPPPDLRDSQQLPPGMTPRMGELARAVAGRRPPLEQALAIETYLRDLPYSYQVQPVPRDGEAVDQFLFEMRQGYCTYYATAMAMMARAVGIPARISVGYATGAYDPRQQVYTVREADAHAWPELLIDGRWLPFEPTPIRPLPTRAGQLVEGPLASVAPPEREAAPPGPTPALAWGVLAAAIALLALGALWLWRRTTRSPVEAAQRRLEQAGQRAGVAWSAGTTLHEFGALLEPHVDGAARALQEAIALVERERYSGQPLDADGVRRLRQAADEVWRVARRRGKGQHLQEAEG